MSAYSPLDREPADATAAHPASISLARRVTPYRAVLQEPTCSLATNHGDRPEIATSAILGYN